MSAERPPLTFPIGGIDDGVIRIRLRADADIPRVVEACQDPGIQAYTRAPDNYTENDAIEFFARVSREAAAGEALSLIIDDVAEDSLIGSIGFFDYVPDEGRLEIGYWLAPWARGRGAMTRAIRLFCGWVFDELDITRIQAGVQPDNKPSQVTIKRAGFTEEGLLRSYFPMKGTRRNIISYSLLRGEL